MPLHWTSKIWFLGKSKGDDHVPIMYFKKGGSGEYTCLCVDRGTWGTTSEAAHNDCPGRKTWAAGTGQWGRRGLRQVACNEDSFSVYSLPLVLFSVMDDMSPGWLLWLSHSPLPVSSCSHSNSRIKQDAPHHKWAQQDHPGIHMWIPPFTQTPAWWHGTFANIMSPDFHGKPGLPSHYLPWTDEKTASEKWNYLPEVTGRVRGRDGDLNSTWD